MKARLPLLDFLRGLAIICVVVDHSFVWLGIDTRFPQIHRYFIFSVAPLFLLAGITTALSFFRRPPKFASRTLGQPSFGTPKSLSTNRPPKTLGSPKTPSSPTALHQIALTISHYLRYVLQKSQTIIIAYLLGSFISQLWLQPSFSFPHYLTQLQRFPNQYYFISIYLQLLAVAPLLCLLYQRLAPPKSPHFSRRLCLIHLVLLSIALIAHQFPIFGHYIYLPARTLFGGIELWIFASGILLAYLYQHHRLPQKLTSPSSLLLFALTLLASLFFSGTITTIMHHPPSLSTLIYCTALLAFFSGLYPYLKKSPLLLTPLTFLGGHSLCIFIYHALFIELALKHFPAFFQAAPALIQVASLTLIGLFCSIAFTIILDKIFALPSYLFKKCLSVNASSS